MGRRQDGTAHPPDVRPVDVDGVRTVAIVTVGWGIAFVIMALRQGQLNDEGRGWWLWTCLAGVGLGLLGLEYCRKRRDAIAQAGLDAEAEDSGEIPAVRHRQQRDDSGDGDSPRSASEGAPSYPPAEPTPGYSTGDMPPVAMPRQQPPGQSGPPAGPAPGVAPAPRRHAAPSLGAPRADESSRPALHRDPEPTEPGSGPTRIGPGAPSPRVRTNPPGMPVLPAHQQRLAPQQPATRGPVEPGPRPGAGLEPSSGEPHRAGGRPSAPASPRSGGSRQPEAPPPNPRSGGSRQPEAPPPNPRSGGSRQPEAPPPNPRSGGSRQPEAPPPNPYSTGAAWYDAPAAYSPDPDRARRHPKDRPEKPQPRRPDTSGADAGDRPRRSSLEDSEFFGADSQAPPPNSTAEFLLADLAGDDEPARPPSPHDRDAPDDEYRGRRARRPR